MRSGRRRWIPSISSCNCNLALHTFLVQVSSGVPPESVRQRPPPANNFLPLWPQTTNYQGPRERMPSSYYSQCPNAPRLGTYSQCPTTNVPQSFLRPHSSCLFVRVSALSILRRLILCLICPRRICAGLFVRNFMEINRGEILSLWERRSQAERPSHLKQWRAKLTFLFSRRTIAIDHVYIDVDTIASRAGQRHDHRPHPVAFFLLSTHALIISQTWQ